jgi:predicted nucleic acid-binding Zn ribbon protein
MADAVARWLKKSGLATRVDQASVVPNWAELVGPQIATVTTPTSVTADGTLFVQVTTNAWMTELSLMEPELLRALNTRSQRSENSEKSRGAATPSIRRIRWLIRPADATP